MSRRSLSRRQRRVLRVFVDNPDREYTGLQVDAELGVPSGTSKDCLARLERLDFLVSRWEEPTEASDGDRPQRHLYRLNPGNAAAARAALARAEARRRTSLVSRALRARPAMALRP